ncbi:hypothetical protein PENTCL1PPCAC_5486, partial [Pristionchus entomophagus]
CRFLGVVFAHFSVHYPVEHDGENARESFVILGLLKLLVLPSEANESVSGIVYHFLVAVLNALLDHRMNERYEILWNDGCIMT